MRRPIVPAAAALLTAGALGAPLAHAQTTPQQLAQEFNEIPDPDGRGRDALTDAGGGDTGAGGAPRGGDRLTHARGRAAAERSGDAGAPQGRAAEGRAGTEAGDSPTAPSEWAQHPRT